MNPPYIKLYNINAMKTVRNSYKDVEDKGETGLNGVVELGRAEGDQAARGPHVPAHVHEMA